MMRTTTKLGCVVAAACCSAAPVTVVPNITVTDLSHGNLADIRYRGFNPCVPMALVDMFDAGWIAENLPTNIGIGVKCPFSFDIPVFGAFDGDFKFAMTGCPSEKLVAAVESSAVTKSFVLEPEQSVDIIPWVASICCKLDTGSNGELELTAGIDLPGTGLDLKKSVDLGATCDNLDATAAALALQPRGATEVPPESKTSTEVPVASTTEALTPTTTETEETTATATATTSETPDSSGEAVEDLVFNVGAVVPPSTWTPVNVTAEMITEFALLRNFEGVDLSEVCASFSSAPTTGSFLSRVPQSPLPSPSFTLRAHTHVHAHMHAFTRARTRRAKAKSVEIAWACLQQSN